MISETPIHWYGLPDLRDGSIDLKQWGPIPVESWHARSMLRLSPTSMTKMIAGDLVDTGWFFGRERILLGSLPQTARCFYIEQLFMPDTIHESQNYLYAQSDIRAALGISPKTIYNKVNTGRMVREMLPNGGFRYPHWGMEEGMAIKVRELYLNS